MFFILIIYLNGYLCDCIVRKNNNINKDEIIIPYPYIFNQTILHSTQIKRKLKLFIYIPVRPCNYDVRRVIRKTWIREFNYKKVNYKFFMGKDVINNENIKKEERYYHDIIQFDFINNYYNLTLLTLLSIEWIYKHVKKYDYVMKCDEDMIPNIYRIFRLIKSFPKKEVPFLAGYKCRKSKVSRKKKAYGYIPYSMYNNKYLPEYVFGGFMFYSKKSIEIIYNDNVSIVPIVYKEDVYIGLIADKYKFRLIDIKKDYSLRSVKFNCSEYRKRACIHGYSSSEIEKFWKKCNTNIINKNYEERIIYFLLLYFFITFLKKIIKIPSYFYFFLKTF